MKQTKPTIGLGILSWKAHETITKTLNSYKKKKFKSLFNENVIYFSDISKEDKLLAEKFKYKAVGSKNLGIAVGTENLAKALKTDYILIAQNDNPLVENLAFVKTHLNEAIKLLEDKKADLVRMRHRWQVGEGFCDVEKYLKYFPAKCVDKEFIPAENNVKKENYSNSFIKKLLRVFRPFKSHNMKGRSVFIEKKPHKLFPKVIKKEGTFFIIDSSVINFSDQCFLISRDFFLNVLMTFVNETPNKRTLNNFQVPEICLNSKWWKQQHFKIAQGQGILTHNRYDGSFRIGHHGYKDTK